MVVPHENYEIYYLGERSNDTFQEYYLPDERISHVIHYHYHSLDEALSAAPKLPLSEEGFVAVDENWNRVKIKNPTYIRAHYLHHNDRPNFLGIPLEREQDEFLAYFPAS